MRIHRRGMDAACRGGDAIAGVFSGVVPTARRGARCGFGVLSMDSVVATGKGRDDRTLPDGGEGTCN